MSGSGKSSQQILSAMVGVARSYGIVGALVVVVVVAQALYPGFLDRANLQNLLVQNVPIGLVAVGMTFVMIAGGFDLSVGASVALGAVVAAHMSHESLVIVFPVTIAVGCCVGLFNALIVTKLNVNPFIATLGSSSVIAGATAFYTGANSIDATDEGFARIATGSFFGMPTSVALFVVVVLVFGIALSRTVYGRSIYSIGGNDEASWLAGIRTSLVRGSTYLVSGACATVAGLLYAASLGAANATIGASITLNSIAIVVIGGTSLFGGEGAVWRSIVGLAILASLTNLFNSLALSSSLQSIIQGAIVILAVATDAFARRRRR